jgi:hypothetical protein
VAARVAAQRAALDNDIEIRPDAIDIRRGTLGQPPYTSDDPWNDVDTFTFYVSNNGRKAISYFNATADLENRAGDVIFSGTIEDADGLAAGHSEQISVRVSFPGTSAADPRLVRNTAVGDTVLHYTVQEIRYQDGSRVARSNFSPE